MNLLENYLKTLSFKGYSPETLKVYRYFLKDKIEKILTGNYDEKWFSENPFTKKIQISILNSFVDYLNQNGHNLPKLKVQIKTPQQVIQPVDYNLISNKINNLPENTFAQLRDKLILTILAKTGIRVSELVNIKHSDINENGEIIIRGKGKKERIVYITNGALDLLTKYLQVKQTFFPNTPTLFISTRGKKLTRSFVYELVHQFLSPLLPSQHKLGPHRLRHAFATHLVNQNINPFVIQKILGHSSINTTLKYVHLNYQDLKPIFNTI